LKTMSAKGLPMPTRDLLDVLRVVAENRGTMPMPELIGAMEPSGYDRRRVQEIVSTGRTAGTPVLECTKTGGNTYKHQTVIITEAGRKLLRLHSDQTPDGDRRERDAFMQAIIERPDDDTPRLVFADWLDDHGDVERAELIRRQCSLSSLPPSSPEFAAIQERVQPLLNARLNDFLTPLTRLRGLRFVETTRATMWGTSPCGGSTLYHCKAVFRRGFVEEITLPGRENIRTFARHAEALFRLTPLRHLEVTDVRGMSETLDQGWFPTAYWVPDIDFVAEEALRALVQLPEIARLRTLLLRLDIGTKEAHALATSPFLTAQTTLLLYPGTYDEEGQRYGRPAAHEGQPTEIERILRDRFGDSVRWCR
jgi:uncharacterized protein (TIGR02996 family)